MSHNTDINGMKVKRTEKYLKALKAIKTLIDENPRVSMTDLGRKFKLTYTWYMIPLEWGVLEKRGSARLVRWYWRGQEPDENMVKEILKRLSKGDYKKRTESKDWEGAHTKMFEYAKSLGYNNVAEAMGVMGNYKFINKFRNRKITLSGRGV